MGSKKKSTTIGFMYFWDIQAGLGRGPVNEIVGITADKKNVFVGTPGQVSASTAIAINKIDLFGGIDVGGEGGIVGVLEVSMGEDDQVPTPKMRSLLPGLVPAFRGKVTTIFSGMISAFSSSPKPWQYRVRRSTKGWDAGVTWYSEKALIKLRNNTSVLVDGAGLNAAQINNLRDIHAMNAAHILVEAATNRSWGRGLSLNDHLDLDSYKVMADTLYDEGFGLCFRYNRQDSLDTFIQQVLDTVGAVQYGDLETGKLKVKLIRGGYDVNDLHLFNYDNGIISVQDDDTSGADSTPNELVVTWHDPVTNEDGEVRAQNLGSIRAVGLISSSVEYKAIPTHELAARVAQRDLETGSAGLTRLVINFDRRGGVIGPADCFRVSLPDRNISNMVMRVGKIEEGQDGGLKITAMQDVFGLPATSYSTGNQGGLWTPPDRTAKPVNEMMVIETPYTTLAATIDAANLSQLSSDAGYIGILAVAPTSMSINYNLQTRAGSAVFTAAGTGDWIPSALLLSDVGRFDTVIDVSLSTIQFDVGDAALIDDEIVRIDAVDLIAGTVTIGRGCADTIPQSHDAGTRIWFYDGMLDSDGVEYIAGEQVSARLLTRTAGAILDENLATIRTVKLDQRQARPYAPGNVRINGELTDEVKSNPFTLSWSHRDRLTQSNNLVAHTEPDVGPEAGVSYLINIYSNDMLLRTIETDQTQWTNSTTSDAFNKLELLSVRDGLESWQRYTLTTGEIIVNPEPTEHHMRAIVTIGQRWSGSQNNIGLYEQNSIGSAVVISTDLYTGPSAALATLAGYHMSSGTEAGLLLKIADSATSNHIALLRDNRNAKLTAWVNGISYEMGKYYDLSSLRNYWWRDGRAADLQRDVFNAARIGQQVEILLQFSIE